MSENMNEEAKVEDKEENVIDNVGDMGEGSGEAAKEPDKSLAIDEVERLKTDDFAFSEESAQPVSTTNGICKPENRDLLEAVGRPDLVYASVLYQVLDLLFWRDIRASAVIFTFSLLVLLSLRCFSIIAVVAYLALSLLAITISIRMYKFVLQTLNGTQQPNPFQSLLDFDIIITRQFTDRYIDVVLNHTNHVLVTGRDLILVRNLPSSLKFGLLMWLLTYIGSWFNGLTLLTIALVFSFSFPPLYVKYQEPIDAYNALACQKMSNLYALAKSKLPGIKQKTQ